MKREKGHDSDKSKTCPKCKNLAKERENTKKCSFKFFIIKSIKYKKFSPKPNNQNKSGQIFSFHLSSTL